MPGLGSQQELPNLELLIEAEALKPKNGWHLARWITPLAASVVGLATFIPLTIEFSAYFLIGAIGFPVLGGVLGYLFHLEAKKISPQQIALRNRCYRLMSRLNGLRNLLGWSPVLAPRVGEVLDEAASLYLKVRLPAEAASNGGKGLWDEALVRAQKSMDEAMAHMLTLAEPDSAQAQEAELNRGWAEPLLEEMRSAVDAIDAHVRSMRAAAMVESQNPALAGLRDSRLELQRLETAVSELEQEVR